MFGRRQSTFCVSTLETLCKNSRCRSEKRVQTCLLTLTVSSKTHFVGKTCSDMFVNVNGIRPERTHFRREFLHRVSVRISGANFYIGCRPERTHFWRKFLHRVPPRAYAFQARIFTQGAAPSVRISGANFYTGCRPERTHFWRKFLHRVSVRISGANFYIGCRPERTHFWREFLHIVPPRAYALAGNSNFLTLPVTRIGVGISNLKFNPGLT